MVKNSVYLLGLWLVWVQLDTYAQVSMVEFGKNRIQHHRDFDQWLSYESQNFVTYWYGKSRNVGQKSAQIAESVYDDIVKSLEFRINDKIELIVYVDITDMKQSNIGNEEILSGTVGQTKIERNKVFVYFNGRHRDLEVQIRRGVAGVLLNYMLFGTEFQEIVQNMVALGLPPWFLQGLISYIGEPWSVEADERLRDGLSRRNYRDFEHFARDNPAIAGYAFWFYLGLNYGKSDIANLVYLIRLNKNIEQGVRSVFGIRYQELLENIWVFMRELNAMEASRAHSDYASSSTVPFKHKRDRVITQVALHPKKPLLAVASNQIGRIRIHLVDLQTGKKRAIFKKGYKNNIQETDYLYPHIVWNESGTKLLYCFEHRDKIYLEMWDSQTGKKERHLLPSRYQRIYSVDFWDDQQLLFSASELNYTDLYLYRLRTRQSRQLTSDIFDDHYAVTGYYQDKKGVFFSSNRENLSLGPFNSDTIVPLGPLNIFFLDPEDKDGQLVRIGSPSLYDQTDLSYVKNKGLYYLSASTGMVNRKRLELHSPENQDAVFVTDVSRNIQAFSVSAALNKVVEVKTFRKQSVITMSDLTKDSVMEPHLTTYFAKYKSKSAGSGQVGIGVIADQIVKSQIQMRTLRETNPDYFFQTEFGDPPDQKGNTEILQPEFILKRDLTTLTRPRVNPGYERINPLRIVPYRLKFRIDFVQTTFDNNPLFGGLEAYSGTGELLFNNPLGLLFKANFKDLFEDYQVEAGLRLPTAFNGAEYFLLFDNKKRKVDKRFALYRRANYRTEGAIANIILLRSRKEILLGMYELRYPLDVYTSFRGAITLRQDRFTMLSSEPNSLSEPPIIDQRAGLRLEYVFDNTIIRELNLLNGTRYKLSWEMVKRFQIQFIDRFSFDLGQGFMNVLIFDGRHYEPLGRHIVWATRVAAATSFGSEKILFLLGGSDNTFVPRFNDNIPLPAGDDFAFQTLAPNLRGFNFNIRNGNSFALVNTEIRIPVFQMLYKRPIRSGFIRNFQIVPFADFGTAWQGLSPFNKDNPLNTIFIGSLDDPTTPIVLKVNYFRDPVVFGYGLGLRTMLFGYFLRVDYARGIDTRIQQRPRFHISMGLDF